MQDMGEMGDSDWPEGQEKQASRGTPQLPALVTLDAARGQSDVRESSVSRPSASEALRT